MNRTNNRDILQLDEYKIHNYCQQYKYNYKMHQNNTVAIIENSYDSWKLAVYPVITREGIKERIEVKHLNKCGNKKRKIQYHLQKHARDIDYVFTDIIGTHITNKGIVDGVFALKNTIGELKKRKHA